jgi:hypothetical protein
VARSRARKRSAKPKVFERTTTEGYADRSEVASFAQELSVNHLHCRELGHLWRPWVAQWAQEHEGYERALRCTRCRTERWQIISASGAVVSSHYVYPEGYIHLGLGRIVGEGRDALRLESLTRALTDTASKAS